MTPVCLVHQRGTVPRPHAQNFGGELPPAEWLRQETLQWGEPRNRVFFGGKVVSRDEHERGFRHERRRLPDEFQAVELRHMVVGDDHARVEIWQSLERLERPRKRMHRAIKILR